MQALETPNPGAVGASETTNAVGMYVAAPDAAPRRRIVSNKLSAVL